MTTKGIAHLEHVAVWLHELEEWPPAFSTALPPVDDFTKGGTRPRTRLEERPEVGDRDKAHVARTDHGAVSIDHPAITSDGQSLTYNRYFLDKTEQGEVLE